MLTVAAGIWGNYEQAKDNFQLTIVKSVAEESTPSGALGKFKFFSDVFPRRLPDNVNVNAEKYTKQRDLTIDSKKLFFEQMREAGVSEPDLLLLWRALFPGDGW